LSERDDAEVLVAVALAVGGALGFELLFNPLGLPVMTHVLPCESVGCFGSMFEI
jgi:hypothetical protein